MINLESPWHLVSASLVFATDTLIASTMCYILYNSRTEYDRCALRKPRLSRFLPRAFLSRTNSIISRLVSRLFRGCVIRRLNHNSQVVFTMSSNFVTR
jgi:hypothetical protein